MYKEILRYIKNLALMTIPFFIFVGIYVWLDPFEVIWHYQNYFASRKVHISLNHLNTSTCNFDNRYEYEKWDSYIIGNSRSRYWRTEDWEKHLPNGSHAYHFDHPGGSSYAVMQTFLYLDKKNVELKNILLILDTRILRVPEPSLSHTSYTPPQMVNYRNLLGYQLTSFEAFCDLDFMTTYFKELFHPITNPSDSDLHNGEFFAYNPINNQVSQNLIEQKIKQGNYYTKEYVDYMFTPDRQFPDSISPRVISKEQLHQLTVISNIVKKHHTDCRVVISPLFEKIKFNPEDLHILQSLFGKDKVYDYSGPNVITNDYHNYYENSHYRPRVTKKIMDEIYN